MTTLEEIREIEAQKSALDDQKQPLVMKAKAEALKQSEAIIETLSELGFPYSLVENPPAKRKRKTKKEMQATNEGKSL